MGVVARREGVFEKYMPNFMTGPIVGALAGNVLKTFRVEIDYQKGYTYFEKTGTLESNDLDLVGLVLRPDQDGKYTVVGLSSQHDSETLEAVHPGDTLLAVSNHPVNRLMMSEVIDLLRGTPDERKVLRLERQSAVVEARVPVVRIL
jgi:C-terminal processing protease CtpA/Prc